MPKPSQDSRYWALPIQGINRAQEELATQKVKVRFFFYDKHSAGSFAKVCAELLRTPLDGILMAPVLPKPFEAFLKKVPEGTPYVFFDSFISEARPLTSIGQDPFQSGVLSAHLMRILVQDSGDVIAFRVRPADDHIEERINGFLQACRRGRMKAHVFDLDGNRGGDARRRAFRKAIGRVPRLRGIFVTNATTNQIAALVKAEGLAGKVHVIGYDPIEENVRWMREGIIDFLISQQSGRQGYEGIQALYRHVVLKMPVPGKVRTQLDIVTRENADDYRS